MLCNTGSACGTATQREQFPSGVCMFLSDDWAKALAWTFGRADGPPVPTDEGFIRRRV